MLVICRMSGKWLRLCLVLVDSLKMQYFVHGNTLEQAVIIYNDSHYLSDSVFKLQVENILLVDVLAQYRYSSLNIFSMEIVCKMIIIIKYLYDSRFI